MHLILIFGRRRRGQRGSSLEFQSQHYLQNKSSMSYKDQLCLRDRERERGERERERERNSIQSYFDLSTWMNIFTSSIVMVVPTLLERGQNEVDLCRNKTTRFYKCIVMKPIIYWIKRTSCWERGFEFV